MSLLISSFLSNALYSAMYLTMPLPIPPFVKGNNKFRALLIWPNRATPAGPVYKAIILVTASPHRAFDKDEQKVMNDAFIIFIN